MSTVPEHHIAFGPVPSRRLGQSLGINDVTTKACSYACVYCQVGPTTDKSVEPRPFFKSAQVREAVTARIDRTRARGLPIDYLTFVPDGEPTLDSALGDCIDVVRDAGIPVAVITNGSLLWRHDAPGACRPGFGEGRHGARGCLAQNQPAAQRSVH